MILTCLGIGVKDGNIFDEVARELKVEGHNLKIVGTDYTVLNENPLKVETFLRQIVESDLLMIKVHGDTSYLKSFDRVVGVINGSDCSAILVCTESEITERYRFLFKGTDEDYKNLRNMLLIGGNGNLRSILLWGLKNIDDDLVDVPELTIPLAQGVYRPGMEISSIEDAIDHLDRDKPVVCIMFHQKFWLVHNLAAIDCLISSLESRGASVLPIFLSSYPKEFNGSLGIKNIIETYLIRDGVPIPDCIVETSGFSQILVAKPGDGIQISDDNFFERLGIPVLQAMMLFDSRAHWEESPLGLASYDIATSVVNPEFDGQIITVPFAGQDLDESGKIVFLPLCDRCDRVADIAYLWASLRKKRNSEKKVAILLYMYPPRQDLAGGASGLDTMESVANLLKSMSKEGYVLDWIPDNGKELVERLLDGVTNDNNWKTDRELELKSVYMIDLDEYGKWFFELPDKLKADIYKGWGNPPGSIHVIKKKQLVPGFLTGNVFVGFQPDRGKTSAEAIHDPETSMPHQYLGFYRWLKYDFGADAVIHVGTHGSLEWLPGKSVGLSQNCCPDAVIDSIPNIYPYIIDNPGEGMQAKRRSNAVVTTHMIPSMTRSGVYEGIGELESMVQAYLGAQSYDSKDKTALIVKSIRASMKSLSFFSDLGMNEEDDVEKKIDDIYDYILEIKDALISDGLHILGDTPKGELLVEMIYSLTRYDNANIPSLRGSLAHSMGMDLEILQKNVSETTKGIINGALVDDIDNRVIDLIRSVVDFDFCMSKCISKIDIDYPNDNEKLKNVVSFICSDLIFGIRGMGREIESMLNALNGEYVLPGPSGCPTRGKAQILPTGTNFYSIDPDGIPWNSSWEIGKKMADQMVERYLNDVGEYPKNIGIVIWATDVMRTGGDDIAYILWLMGLRPIWAGYGGRIKGLEVVSTSELGRPRVDVTLRISGLFRDTFPNLVNMIDDGVMMISDLDESEEENNLAANVRKKILDELKAGVPMDEARRYATIRIFGDAPGQYGCGVNTLMTTGNWMDVTDLGREYKRTGCHAYGRGLCGQAKPDLFSDRLMSMDVTVKNHNNRECDMFDCDDDYDYLGGFNAAVRSVKGSMPESFMGDSSDMSNIKLRSTAEECRFIFRSKINNPKWLDGLKRHGFRGAQEISTLFDYVVAWDATSGIIDDWMYDDIAEEFVLDDDTREWIKDENPYAMLAMLSRLQEAIGRGMWNASDEMKDRLKDHFMETEERIEEITDR